MGGNEARMALGPKLMRPMPMLMRGRFGRLGRCAAFLTSCAASRSRVMRLTFASADCLRAMRPSVLYPVRAFSLMRDRPSLSRFASTGISFALSASEMSMRLSTSRATERSAVRLSSMVPSVVAAASGDGAAPAPGRFLAKVPVSWLPLRLGMSRRMSTDRRALLPPRPVDAVPASIASRGLGGALLGAFDLNVFGGAASVETLTWVGSAGSSSSSDAASWFFHAFSSAMEGICAGSVGKRPSSRACPLLGGIDSRLLVTGWVRWSAPARLACSAPVSVVLGVCAGLLMGVDPGETPPASSASSPSNPSTPRSAMVESSRRKPRPCSADRV